eukprot:gnl/MRDRNA2_/MRDRNA2_69771_c0_seq2.p1 gnl/MRDRNA2_/MRDRNA2_69771_c0~~gnl/MRDRNA2_/MRDRNA2_69771_c0_seq2.p1  ORF type:complete len:579 (+),score=95.47 gnl/MRDRNA2_/MRDRNA2_69771_c0_seq2:63-1799(+)
MAAALSVADALAILQKARDSSSQDAATRRNIEADCKSMVESLRNTVAIREEKVKQAEQRADQARMQSLGQKVAGSPHLSRNEILARLPEGASVAVIRMLGSLCPITLGHVQCYIEARHIILGNPEMKAPRPARLEHFDECLGLVWLNGDSLVGRKLLQKGQKALNYQERSHLVELVTAEHPWLCYDDGSGFLALCQRWPHLNFIEFDMNGADDVVKYSKWVATGPRNRMITMGRPGSTAAVVDGMKRSRINADDGNCFLGPELPDISSTAARQASFHGDCKALLKMVHPAVAEWMLRSNGHEELANRIASTNPHPATASMETGELLLQALQRVPGHAELRELLRQRLVATSQDFSESFNEQMDRLLQEELASKSVTCAAALPPVPGCSKLSLWKGDITTLEVDAIVNAANAVGLGCFQPNHRCIDNVIHCASGPRLRAACHQLLPDASGHRIPTGQARITSGFNLPAKFVLHTTGPVGEKPKELSSCYQQCLDLASKQGLRSVAFCCISTGIFGYPADRAAQVAIRTVCEWLDQHPESSIQKIVFNVFLDTDMQIYQSLLTSDDLLCQVCHPEKFSIP